MPVTFFDPVLNLEFARNGPGPLNLHHNAACIFGDVQITSVVFVVVRPSYTKNTDMVRYYINQGG